MTTRAMTSIPSRFVRFLVGARDATPGATRDQGDDGPARRERGALPAARAGGYLLGRTVGNARPSVVPGPSLGEGTLGDENRDPRCGVGHRTEPWTLPRRPSRGLLPPLPASSPRSRR